MSNEDSKIVRFKMRVVDNDRSEATLARVVMNSVYDTEPKTEHGKYVPGEPQGPIRFHISNPNVASLFVFGQDYYVDFTPTFQEAGSTDDLDDNAGNITERKAQWEEQNGF